MQSIMDAQTERWLSVDGTMMSLLDLGYENCGLGTPAANRISPDRPRRAPQNKRKKRRFPGPRPPACESNPL
jgi:hypothetical protein